MAELFTASDALLRLLDIGQEDILANRRGTIGPRQRSGSRRTLLLLALGAGVIGGGLIIGGVIAGEFVPVAMGGVVLAFALLALAGVASSGRAPVLCITGPVEVVAMPMGKGHGTGLTVGGKTYPVPPGLRSTYADWQAAIGPNPYRVYIAGSSANVVGIEPGVR